MASMVVGRRTEVPSPILRTSIAEVGSVSNAPGFGRADHDFHHHINQLSDERREAVTATPSNVDVYRSYFDNRSCTLSHAG